MLRASCPLVCELRSIHLSWICLPPCSFLQGRLYSLKLVSPICKLLLIKNLVIATEETSIPTRSPILALLVQLQADLLTSFKIPWAHKTLLFNLIFHGFLLNDSNFGPPKSYTSDKIIFSPVMFRNANKLFKIYYSQWSPYYCSNSV